MIRSARGHISSAYDGCRIFWQATFHNAQWQELSMGTSLDFVAAVQEGATFVRVGQAILGPRIKIEAVCLF